MKNVPEQPVNPRIPSPSELPSEFEHDLRAMDERLNHAARMSAVPAGLSERMFEASVSLLPQHQTQHEVETMTTSRLRLVGASSRAVPLHRTGWGQFAMAASLLLVCGVAIWFHSNPIQRGSGPMAKNVRNEVSLSLAQLESSPHEADSEFDTQWRYLLDTKDLFSPDQITGELYMLVAQQGL